MYTADKEHNKEIRKTYGDGYLDGFNDGRKLDNERIKDKIAKENLDNALKSFELHICPMCKYRLSKDNTCIACTIKAPSHYSYDENWL